MAGASREAVAEGEAEGVLPHHGEENLVAPSFVDEKLLIWRVGEGWVLSKNVGSRLTVPEDHVLGSLPATVRIVVVQLHGHTLTIRVRDRDCDVIVRAESARSEKSFANS